MNRPTLLVKGELLQHCLDWFQPAFRQGIVSLIETQFPNYPLPSEVQAVLQSWVQIRKQVEATSESVDIAVFFANQFCVVQLRA
jgi:hypothetical protein